MMKNRQKKSSKYAKSYYSLVPSRRLNSASSKIAGFSKRLKPGVLYSKTVYIVRRKPLISFIAALLLLFLVIFATNTIFKPKVQEVPEQEIIKTVDVYNIGEAPRLKVQAQVQKSGVIVVMAQSPGIVQSINVKEGDSVQKGRNLVSLSTNYQGGNAASLSRQIAQKQYQNIKDTFDKQKEIIGKQKDLAGQNAQNTEEQRKIQEQSLTETRDLLSQSSEILSLLDQQIKELDDTNVGGVNDDAIFQLKQTRSASLAGANQVRGAMRQLDYSVSTTNPPAQINNLTKDISIKQLEVQEKALELNKEVARLQYNLALVNEASMFPSAPCAGVIQKIHVSAGEQVNPGTPLVTIYVPTGNVTAVARVSKSVASGISKFELSNLYIGEKVFATSPRFISTEATDGQLYQVVYDIPEDYKVDLTNASFISVEIPFGRVDTSSVIPLIPLEAVFQTQDAAFVYVIEGGNAASRRVTLGNVLGATVEINSGIKSGDRVILNRNIISGDKISLRTND